MAVIKEKIWGGYQVSKKTLLGEAEILNSLLFFPHMCLEISKMRVNIFFKHDYIFSFCLSEFQYRRCFVYKREVSADTARLDIFGEVDYF